MFKCLQYDRFHTSSWVNITIHRFWNWAIFLHKKNENWMHFHKVQNHTPYNFRHSEPMLCHHLNPVDEKLGEQRNKTKERKKMRKSRRKSRRTTAASADTHPSAVATGMMTMTGLFWISLRSREWRRLNINKRTLHVLSCVSVSFHRQS